MTYKYTKFVDCKKAKELTGYIFWGILTGLIIFTVIDEWTSFHNKDVYSDQVCYHDFLIANHSTCYDNGMTDPVILALVLSFILLIANTFFIWLRINLKLQIIEFRCKDNIKDGGACGPNMTPKNYQDSGLDET